MLTWKMNRQLGLATVEFAMVAPVLLLFGFVAADFGSVFHLKNTLTKAAHAAARYVALQGCIAPEEGSIESNALNDVIKPIALNGGFFLDKYPQMPRFDIGYAETPTDPTPKACAFDKYVWVTASFDFKWVASRMYPGGGLGEGVTIRAQAIQRVTGE